MRKESEKKKRGPIRTESEKKTRMTSVRMTEQQYAVIEQKAAAKGMSVSGYMIDASVHGNGGVTSVTLVRMQNLVNRACEIIIKDDPEQAERLEKEANGIWSM